MSQSSKSEQYSSCEQDDGSIGSGEDSSVTEYCSDGCASDDELCSSQLSDLQIRDASTERFRPVQSADISDTGISLKCKAELYIHLVSCPATKLRKNGPVFIKLHVLDHHVRTQLAPPKFPLFYHATYECTKQYDNCKELPDLETSLEKETVTFELVQQFDDNKEVTLAVFDASGREIFFPFPATKPSTHGIDLDLLMEPSLDFPTLLAPKIEISTRMTVGDAGDHYDFKSLAPLGPRENKHGKFIRPYSRVTSQSGYDESLLLQSRPPFVVRRVDSRLLARIPNETWSCNKTKQSRCRPFYRFEQHKTATKYKDYNTVCAHSYRCYKCGGFFVGRSKYEKLCVKCRSFHIGDECKICCKYRNYFGLNCEGTSDDHTKKDSPSNKTVGSSPSWICLLGKGKETYVRLVLVNPKYELCIVCNL